MTTSHLPPALSLLTASLLLTLAPTPAQAQPTERPRESGARLDADLDLGAPMNDLSGAFALGAGGRFGWRFDLGPVWLQPEIGGSYTVFLRSSCDICQIVPTRHPVRVFGGVRIGGSGLIAGLIEPSLFGHAGYGWVVSAHSGSALDVGFALDVRVNRHFRFGVHGAYNVVLTPSDMDDTPPTAEKWISYGLHAGVAF